MLFGEVVGPLGGGSGSLRVYLDCLEPGLAGRLSSLLPVLS